MKKITLLEEKIAFLRYKQSDELLELKNQYYTTVESLKPLNLIKSATQEIISMPNLKSSLVNGAIGFGLNYVSNNFLNENATNPIKRVLGKVLKFTLKNFVGKKSKKI
jgi:hypothetical protein